MGKTKSKSTKKKAFKPSDVKKALVRMSESKHTVIQANGTLTNTGTWTCVSNTLTQGSSDVQRIGDTASVRDLLIRYNLIPATTYNFVRILVVQHKIQLDTSVSTPADSALLFAVTPANITLYPQDWDHQKQFRVLYDKRFSCPNANVDAKGHKALNIKIPGKKLSDIKFNAGSATDAYNHIWVVAMCDTNATAYPTYNMVSHLRTFDP